MRNGFGGKMLAVLLIFVSGLANAAAGDIKHIFIATDESGKQLIYVDEFNPANDWTAYIGKNRDLQVVGESVIFNTNKGYIELALKTGRLIKRIELKGLNGVMSLQRTADGKTYLSNGRTLWLLDQNDKISKKIALKFNPQFFRIMRLSKDGNLLFTSDTTKMVEIDQEGNAVRTFDLQKYAQGISKAYAMKQLADGNYMISTGFGFSLLIVSPEGELVRQIGGKGKVPELKVTHFMAEAQQLPNGNFVCTHWTGHGRQDSKKAPQAVEFDQNGKVVWQWHDPKRAGTLHGITVLK